MSRRLCIITLMITVAIAAMAFVAPLSAYAAAKPVLSKDAIELKYGQKATIKIKNVDEADVKKLTVKTNSDFTVKTKSKIAFVITPAVAKDGAKANVNVKLVLKKKVAGKSSYSFKLKATTPKQQVVVKPEPMGNDSVMYIDNLLTQHDLLTSTQTICFALKDKDLNRVCGSGIASIDIVNESGESVYSEDIRFGKSNFSTWNDGETVQYLCNIGIADSEIVPGRSSEGRVMLNVTLDNGAKFSTQSLVVIGLPLVSSSESNDDVVGIGEYLVKYVPEQGCQRVFFSLSDEEENRIYGTGIAAIEITNSEFEQVYSNKIRFGAKDFGTWVSSAGVERYLCSIDIPDSEIAQGASATGSFVLKITLDNEASFNVGPLTIGDLPAVVDEAEDEVDDEADDEASDEAGEESRAASSLFPQESLTLRQPR